MSIRGKTTSEIRALLERPLPEILAAGGDSRQSLDSRRFNRYGCATQPRADVAPFGSCTASSVSESGYRAAEQLLSRFRALADASDLRSIMSEYYDGIREELRFLLTRGQAPEVDVVLSPSGTDAELLALALAFGDGSKPVTNVLVGPTEVGTGTPNAAAGLHFDTVVPNGEGSDVGAPVCLDLAHRTELVTVELRTPAGEPRGDDEIDAEVESLVHRRIDRGHRVLLHVIAHSKTGLHAPSLAAVERLRRLHGEQLLVMVDAAQGRFSRRGLVNVLRSGYLVLMTGSKFYGGPPFAGALLVPPNAHPARRGLPRLTGGFGSFFSQDMFASGWSKLCHTLPISGNLGLLFRWFAAIAEIRDYYATPSTLRLQILRTFERVAPQLLGASQLITIEPSVEPIYADEFDRVLQSKTTVFPFTVSRPRGELLSRDELVRVWRWLNDDISDWLPGAGRALRSDLAAKMHVGQPVELSSGQVGPAVLRVALGGVLLSRIAHDLSWGRCYDERLERMSSDLTALGRKVEAIAANFDALNAAADAAQPISVHAA